MIQTTSPLSNGQMRLLERALLKTVVTGELLRACLVSNSIPPEVEQMLLQHQVALENGNLSLLSSSHIEPDRDQVTSVPPIAYIDGNGSQEIHSDPTHLDQPEALVKHADVMSFLEWTEAGIGEWRSIALSVLEMNRKLRAELAVKSGTPGQVHATKPMKASALASLERLASQF
ncbi:MAG: hypothetical protein Q7V53_02930 [Caldisericota bacterium]|nr:hypothetical protein [Caldisericota bacterium]